MRQIVGAAAKPPMVERAVTLLMAGPETFQMSSAYSRIARSEENQAIWAVLRMLAAHHAPDRATNRQRGAAWRNRRRNPPSPWKRSWCTRASTIGA